MRKNLSAKFSKSLVLGCLLGWVLLCGAVGAAEDHDSPPREDELQISLAGLPLFVFVDETLQLRISLTNYRDRPKRVSLPFTPSFAATVTIKQPAQKQTTHILKVPLYRDRFAEVNMRVDFNVVPHQGVFHFRVKRKGHPAVEAEAVALRVNHPVGDLRIHGDHLEDKAGRRVILLIPRRDETAQRQWAPACTLCATVIQNRADTLVIGATYGDNSYAHFLTAKAKKLFPTAKLKVCTAAAGNPAILRLLLTALAADTPRPQSGNIILFTGVEDIRSGLSTQDYYLGLHALAAIFDSSAKATITTRPRLIIATPPPFGEPFRRQTYANIVKRVACERLLRVCDLSDVFASLPKNKRSTLLSRQPSAAMQREIAKRLLAATQTDPALPQTLFVCGLFALASASLCWLWIRARVRIK